MMPTPSAGLLTAMLDTLPTGLLLCGASGHVQVANEAARRELHSAQWLALDAQGTLVAVSAGARGPLHKAMTAAVVQRRHTILDVGAAGASLLLAVVPLPASAEPHEGALVLLGRQRVCSELALQLVAQLYGLTASEREVLEGLLAGRTVRQMATERGREMSTLRAQIASILGKIGKHRMEDVVRHVSLMPWTLEAGQRSPALRLPTAPAGAIAASCQPALEPAAARNHAAAVHAY
jgi:DNA-binding NarL/FixJ family response regulator